MNSDEEIGGGGGQRDSTFDFFNLSLIYIRRPSFFAVCAPAADSVCCVSDLIYLSVIVAGSLCFSVLFGWV